MPFPLITAQAAHKEEAPLRIDREYQPGDTIVIESDTAHLWVQMDMILLLGEVYLPSGTMTWPSPKASTGWPIAPWPFRAAATPSPHAP